MICINNTYQQMQCPVSPTTSCNFYEFSQGINGNVGEPVYLCNLQVIMPPAVQLPRTGGGSEECFALTILFFAFLAIFITAIFMDILKDK